MLKLDQPRVHQLPCLRLVRNVSLEYDELEQKWSLINLQQIYALGLAFFPRSTQET